MEMGAELYVFLCSVSDGWPRKMQEDVFKQRGSVYFIELRVLEQPELVK
jgi:hypothetical protein